MQPLHALRWAGKEAPQALALPHGVERIEALGNDAVAVGAKGQDLHFTSIGLGSQATAAGSYIRANAAQGETRSHGFFYKPDTGSEGVIGLPILGATERAGPRKESASVRICAMTGWP